MRRIGAMNVLVIAITAGVPARADTFRNSTVLQNGIVRWIGLTAFNTFLSRPRIKLSPMEVEQIAFKVGISLQVGYGTVGPISAQRQEAQQQAPQPRVSQFQAPVTESNHLI